MTTRSLLQALDSLAAALQARGARSPFAPAHITLTALVERLDALIDQLLDEGVQDDGPLPHRRGTVPTTWDAPARLAYEAYREARGRTGRELVPFDDLIDREQYAWRCVARALAGQDSPDLGRWEARGEEDPP